MKIYLLCQTIISLNKVNSIKTGTHFHAIFYKDAAPPMLKLMVRRLCIDVFYLNYVVKKIAVTKLFGICNPEPRSDDL